MIVVDGIRRQSGIIREVEVVNVFSFIRKSVATFKNASLRAISERP